jgi:hypothetical protein
MHLSKYVEPETEESEEQETEPIEIIEPAPQPVIIVISERNENTIVFETTNGYFGLSNGESVNFTDPLTITEGEDKWSVLRVMHKDNVDAKLKDILEKRVLMRAIIDERDSKQDSAYLIGGVMESTAPASFAKANAFVIESLEQDLVLNNDNFPSESVMYIIKAKNSFNVDGCSHIIINNNGTGFTTDRSFEIWLEKDTGQKDMLIFKNGTVESNALNRGECVRLFFDYETSHWSIVYIGNDNANNTLVTSTDGTIDVVQTGQTVDLSRDFYVKKNIFTFYGLGTLYAIKLAEITASPTSSKGAFSFDISSWGMPHLYPYYADFLVDLYLSSTFTKFRYKYFGGEHGGYSSLAATTKILPTDFVLIRKSTTKAELWKIKSFSIEESSQIGIKLCNAQIALINSPYSGANEKFTTQQAFDNYITSNDYTKILPAPFANIM